MTSSLIIDRSGSRSLPPGDRKTGVPCRLRVNMADRLRQVWSRDPVRSIYRCACALKCFRLAFIIDDLMQFKWIVGVIRDALDGNLFLWKSKFDLKLDFIIGNDLILIQSNNPTSSHLHARVNSKCTCSGKMSVFRNLSVGDYFKRTLTPLLRPLFNPPCYHDYERLGTTWSRSLETYLTLPSIHQSICPSIHLSIHPSTSNHQPIPIFNCFPQTIGWFQSKNSP